MLEMEIRSSTATVTPLDPNYFVAGTPLPFPLEGVTASDEYWYADGNLILVARDVAFRIYRGLLADQSTTLADMAAASSDNFYETFDGCPIVRLSDSPQDLTHLFRILVPKSQRRLHPKDKHKHTLDELSALARLSHKYRIHDVEEQALDLLWERYADDFDKWRFGLGQSLTRPTLHADCIGVVNIARLTDTPSLLPVALYSCCMLGADLMDGWKREDGCVEHLSSDDLKRCYTAQEKLSKARADILCEILTVQASRRCPDPGECCAGLKDLVLSMVEGKLSSVVGRAALRSSVDSIHTKAIFRNVCSACRGELQARDVRARRKLWNKLPEIFEIIVPGWGGADEHSEPDVAD